MKSIKDIMTRDVEIATSDMTLKEAARIMKDKDIGSLPVCEGRRVTGIVTDRDITIRGVAEGRDPASTPVRDVMSQQVVSVLEDAELKKAEELMHDWQLRRLPVLNEGGELVGYIAMARIARTESPEQAGKVIKGVSQPTRPEPMKSYGQRGY